MHNNKVYTILHHFDKNDFKQFNKYINSPYFNKSKLLIQYYELLEKQIHSANPDEFPKEKFWKKLFSPLKYNDVRFRKLSSDLLRIIEGFLAQQVYDENNLQKDAYLIESVGRKGIEKYYSSAMRIAENNTQKHQFEDAEFYLSQYRIQKKYHEINQHEYKHSERQNLEEIDNLLTKFYLSEKLRYYCAFLSQKQRGTHKYNLNLPREVITLIQQGGNIKEPALSIYYQIYLTYIEEHNVEHYFKLKSLLKKYGDKFQSIEAKTLYDSAINYCVKKGNQGQPKFVQELFDIYEDFLNKGAIYIEDELDPAHFKNIITVALRLGKYDWTEDFIQTKKNKLPEQSRDNAVTFNLARLYYYKKDYDKVISLLREVEYENMVYNLSSKALLLATYYEIDEIDPMYSLLESFRTYLNRRKDIAEDWKKAYLNLIRFTKKLSKIIPGEDKAIQKLKHEMTNASGGIANVEWLNNKIAELE